MKKRLLILLSFCFAMSASAAGILDTLPNPGKLFLGQSTDGRGLQSVGDAPPTFRPRNRYYTFTHRDTVAKVTWEWSGFTGKWNAYGDITQALPPVPVTSTYPGYDRRTAKWVDSDDSNEHVYNYVLSAWVPADGIHVSATTPTDVSSGGSNGAAVYTKSFWYDSANSLLKKFNGSSWENIGSGGGGSDSTAVLRADINNLQALSGRPDGSTNLGTFTGSTISDNVAIKPALQSLETAVEGKLSSEVDGSTTNELQTIANTSDATSHTVTLSNSGGTVQLVEGSNISLTTTGTSGAGVVTIAATGGSAGAIVGNANTASDTLTNGFQKIIVDLNDGSIATRNNGTTTQRTLANGFNVMLSNATSSTGGTFTPDLSAGAVFRHTVSSGSTLTIANATNNAGGRVGNVFRTLLKNSSGGSVTVSFGTNWREQDWMQASNLTLANNDSIILDWKSEFKGGAFVLTAMSDLGGSGGGGGAANAAQLPIGSTITFGATAADTTAEALTAIAALLNVRNSATGVVVDFSTRKVFGTSASPVSGNVTFNLAGAAVDEQYMIHKAYSAPTFPASAQVEGTYVSNSNNHISFRYINSTTIGVSINTF